MSARLIDWWRRRRWTRPCINRARFYARRADVPAQVPRHELAVVGTPEHPKWAGIVPALPLSRDRSRLEALKRSLVAYRLAFGQPRQEELVAYLRERFSAEEIEELKPELHINLAPKVRH